MRRDGQADSPRWVNSWCGGRDERFGRDFADSLSTRVRLRRPFPARAASALSRQLDFTSKVLQRSSELEVNWKLENRRAGLVGRGGEGRGKSRRIATGGNIRIIDAF